jgi:hypothetical protein
MKLMAERQNRVDCQDVLCKKNVITEFRKCVYNGSRKLHPSGASSASSFVRLRRDTPHLLRYELLAVVTTPSQLKPCICGTDGA